MNDIYRAIIIDDEKLIREGLVHYIDWESLDITVCATCADGISGMEAVLEHRPHIILSDIAMPNLDGIMLLEQVRSHGMCCEVIFISSYSNFDYAQKAVKLGAFDYLLKPIEAHVLYESVSRCIAKLETSKQSAIADADDEAYLDRMLLDALTTLPQANQLFLNLAKRCGLPLENGVLFALAAHCPQLRLRRLLEGTEWAVRSLVVEISPSLTACCVFFETGVATVQCKALTEMFENHGLTATATICQSDIYGSFVEAQMQLLKMGTMQITDAEMLTYDGNGLPSEVVESLNLNLLESSLLTFLIDCYTVGTLSHLVDFMIRCSTFFECCYQQLEQYYGKPLQGFRTQSQYLSELRSGNNVVDTYVCLSNILSELFGLLRVRSMMGPYTRNVLKLIHRDYSQNLSLKQIAHQLNISTSHLSAVFKEDTGYSFSDYLYRYRMNAAQELIRAGNYKIYQVGALVGYPDMVQFSKRFKKFFGYSPKQWQHSTLRQEESI